MLGIITYLVLKPFLTGIILGRMDTLVLDIETKKLLREIGSRREDYPQLGVSLVGVYSYQKDRFKAFREEEFAVLEDWLRAAGQVVGFNLYGFDYPVLEGHLDFDLNKVETIDIMDEIRRVISRRVSLNAVAAVTLGVEKSADGLKAIQFYHQGNWSELEKYCLDDVRITRDLFDYGQRHKYVKITRGYTGKEKIIPVKWQLITEKNYLSPTRQSQEQLF